MTDKEDWGRFTDAASSDTEPGYALVAGVELRVTAGPDAKTIMALDTERLGIGTAEGNTLVLHDPSVSRFHCELLRGTEGLLLRDLDSTNGTFLDGYRVREVFLRPGARIRVGHSELRCEERGAVKVPISSRQRFGELSGKSTAMRRLFELLERLASSDVSVLIEGETGTGKELVARALHDASPRRDGPFQVVDSGSLPAGLVESELFGHEKGAFTGAAGVRIGAFEAADGGTLFIDELGELPMDLQPKLLRILETREVRRIGSTQPRKVDVRFVAATNRDLRREVNRKTFRSDLYFRIAQVSLHLPPLRERPEDIPMLIERFLDQIQDRRPSGPTLRIPAGRLTEMQRYGWPGNVRELRNYLERAVALEVDGAVDHSLPSAEPAEPGVDIGTPFGVAKAAAIEKFEREYLSALIAHAGGNVSQASREAQVDRAHLLGLLRKYGLR
jgi:transcriptional regulator with GAF, ATPase, and Fis domain